MPEPAKAIQESVKPPPSSRRKREIRRPYAPSYVTREEIAFRLQVSVSTVDSWIARNLLPAPVMVFTVRRYRWTDIEERIETQNLLATDAAGNSPSPDGDEFLDGVQRVAGSHG